MTGRRRSSTCVGMVVPLLTLAACSPAVDGVAGVGVDSSGRIVGFVRTCEQRVNSAVLATRDADVSRDVIDYAIGLWELHPDSRSQTITWVLTDRASPATSALKQPPQIPESPLRLGAFAADGSSRTAGVSFTLARVRELPSGSVLIARGDVVRESELASVSCASSQPG